jgi:MFS family permease
LLSVAENSAQVLIGAAFWGLHLGLTEGLLSKLVADFAAAPLRATAFGIFNFVTGVTLLLSSVLAGVLWSAFGAAATFMAGHFRWCDDWRFVLCRRWPTRRIESLTVYEVVANSRSLR